MRHSTLRQLEVFEAIARLGSFTRAAEELFLTQPTVSMQIKKLTEAVGLPLFEQVGKKIFLTDAGRELYEGCRDILNRIDELSMSFDQMKGLKKGRLRLTVVTNAKYFAPELLGKFCDIHPGIEVALNICNRDEACARLARNEDDLYMLGEPPSDIEVVSVPFLQNPLVVVARVDHPLAKQKDITLRRLAQEPFLVREAGSGTRQAFDRLLKKHGLKVNVKMEISSSEAIKHAVYGGLGIAVLSRHALGLSDSTRQLVELDVQHFPIRRHWYLVHPASKQLSVVAKAFFEFLEDHAQSVLQTFPNAAKGTTK